jgi:uncharacterized protein (DUF305 family)
MNGRRRRWGFGLLALGLVAAVMALGVGTALAAGGRTWPPGGGHGMGGMMGNVDQHFIIMMIPHHEGAIAMADLALGTDQGGQPRAQHQEILDLATTIKSTQAQEIADMRSWYQAWYGAAVPTTGAMGGMGGTGEMMGGMMGGMMGDADLATLRGLSGEAFDRAFIAQMIPHHQMAVHMAQMAPPGAQHQELRGLLRAIVANQNAEIAQMQSWYLAWYGEPVPSGGHGMGAMPMGGGPMHGPGQGMPMHDR